MNSTEELAGAAAHATEHADHGFNWLSLIPGFDVHGSGHVLLAALVIIGVLVAASVARMQLNRALKREDEGLIPDRKLTFRNFFEILAEQLYGLAVSVMGEHSAQKFFPIVGTLFIFVFTCNFIGLIPGLLPPTDNLNTTLALGSFVFLYYNWMGLKEHGIAYLKHFLGPVLWLAPLMVVIEVVSHIARPFSLALRLRGNIMGDHMVLGMFNEMAPYLVPVIFYGMGLFVSFIQAFVFCLMTMVYISLSTSHDH
jgi:F-type H+-transporting ATPase subunit a